MGSYEKDPKKKGQPDQNIGTYAPVLPVYQTQQVNEDIVDDFDDESELGFFATEKENPQFIINVNPIASQPVPMDIRNTSIEHQILSTVSKLVAQTHSKIVFPTKPQGGNGGSYAKPDVLIDFLHGTTENDGVQLTVHKVSQHKVIPKPNGWVEIFSKVQAREHLIGTVKGIPGAPESVYTFINKKGDVEFGGIDKNGVKIPLNQECINALAPVVATMMQTVLGNACIYEHDASHTQDISKLIEKVEAEISQTHAHDLENKENISPVPMGSTADVEIGELNFKFSDNSDRILNIKKEGAKFLFQESIINEDNETILRTLEEGEATDAIILKKANTIVSQIPTLNQERFNEFKKRSDEKSIDFAITWLESMNKAKIEPQTLSKNTNNLDVRTDMESELKNRLKKQHQSTVGHVKSEAPLSTPPKTPSIRHQP